MDDVVVIGGGHNGLVAAAYLAQTGLRVRVVERDTVLGGAVSTVERFPGYRVDRGSSAHLMIRHTPIPDELELSRHGLHYLDCDPWAFAPDTDGGDALVFSVDLMRTCANIERVCGPADAEAYREFIGVWTPRAQAMMRAFCEPATVGRFGRAFGGLYRTGTTARRGPIGRRAGAMSAMAQDMMLSGDALLDRWFDSPRLKAALSWFGAQSGPPMTAPGTAPMIGFAALMHQIPPGRAVGGSGALTTALLARLDADGAVVESGCAVTSLRRRRGGWQIVLADGRSRRARHVIAACHITATLDLLADAAPRDVARWRRSIDVGNGIGMAVRLGTTALPDYPGLPADLPAHGVHSGLGLLAGDRSDLTTAYADARAGRLPRRPAVVAMSFSALDPTLAPPHRHQINLWAQWHPYRLARELTDVGHSWATLADTAADTVLAEFDRFAPGIAAAVEHRHVQTPADLESELALPAGNIMHVEMSIDQMFMWRPHPDLAGHTVPGVEDLFLAGASTHPGGGVTGASGRIAAHAVLARVGGPQHRLKQLRRTGLARW
ncbi:NAD(P)/FAD-dependent oxidoreductase [Gordonia sp. TBRC 11910]|uniref:Pyridine nucleotide-disulfide oxidoreductase domain-containing protein 2 n=1 Tax=Gordonia asplenii TaxID=2725283 RepID=A0A848KX08_9ACTN|nr:NAD(P)/FAD-dependent oxidoreductase [Gordonia asplenii]NMO03334.1 NAD(P)/FAD-dependent oxidoreductase [Gordonia asplenii]